jgi:hypothetical protein
MVRRTLGTRAGTTAARCSRRRLASGEPFHVVRERFAFGDADELLQLLTGDRWKPGGGEGFEAGDQPQFEPALIRADL